MADTGAPYFIPYVEPTDLVRDYPAADEASADAIAAALDGIPVLAGIGTNVVQAVKTDIFSTTSTSFVDVTDLSVTITPSSATAKILVVASVNISANGTVSIKLTGGNTSGYIGDAAGSRIRTVNQMQSGADRIDVSMNMAVPFFLDSPASAVAVTYKVQCAAPAGTATVNNAQFDGDTSSFGRGASTLTAIEVAA